jgi:hypothetical protein
VAERGSFGFGRCLIAWLLISGQKVGRFLHVFLQIETSQWQKLPAALDAEQVNSCEVVYSDALGFGSNPMDTGLRPYLLRYLASGSQ